MCKYVCLGVEPRTKLEKPIIWISMCNWETTERMETGLSLNNRPETIYYKTKIDS